MHIVSLTQHHYIATQSEGMVDIKYRQLIWLIFALFPTNTTLKLDILSTFQACGPEPPNTVASLIK